MNRLDDLLEAKRKIESNQKPIINKAYANPKDARCLIMAGLKEGIDFFVSDNVPEGNIYVSDSITPIRIIDFTRLFNGESKMLSLCFEQTHKHKQEQQTIPMNREQRRKAERGKKKWQRKAM